MGDAPPGGFLMATDVREPATTVPPLRHGDRLSRAEFERRWAAMPDLKRAELIYGRVCLMPTLSADHGEPHFDLIKWLGLYQMLTRGVAGADNASVRFDDDSMPQPDALLRVTQNGSSRVDDDRIYSGPPELVAEVARSSVGYDLGAKKELYRAHGVQEYIVWRVEAGAVDWFALRPTGYELLPVGADGIVRSEVFPGLWLDPAALVAGDGPALLRAAQLGHGSPEHAEFVRRLAATPAG
jgi:Uma2 family endonuclease